MNTVIWVSSLGSPGECLPLLSFLVSGSSEGGGASEAVFINHQAGASIINVSRPQVGKSVFCAALRTRRPPDIGKHGRKLTCRYARCLPSPSPMHPVRKPLDLGVQGQFPLMVDFDQS